jgi:hypothetical protein
MKQISGITQKKQRFIVPIIVLFVITSSIVISLMSLEKTTAKPVVGFSAGKIIDDLVFINKNSMGVQDIQLFLNSKVPVCDNLGTRGSTPTARRDYVISRGYTYPMTCLKEYQEGGFSAAQIIYNAAQEFNINPQVLIVLLQKEQGLVTDDWPVDIQYRSATGYGCPDTAPCDSQYYGLTNQIRWSARMFRAIFNSSPTWYTPYLLGDNFVAYNPNSSCGGAVIHIANKATQALYNYTPYQPNSAALGSAYGTGDACSAYGNRNFYQYFVDWFGSTKVDDTLNQHPDGTLINLDNKIFLIEESSLHYISTATIFESHNYRWDDVKPATTGDKQLPFSYEINYIKPGVLFASRGTDVYVNVEEDGYIRKKVMSYLSFLSLGYSWSQVHFVPPYEIPDLTSEGIYFLESHPNGTLIKNNHGVFLIENNTKRYISPSVFDSYRWRWTDILEETLEDSSLPIGDKLEYRKGSIISDGTGLYVIGHTETKSTIKSPIGPWECYSNIYKYNLKDIIHIPVDLSPIQSGPKISC